MTETYLLTIANLVLTVVLLTVLAGQTNLIRLISRLKAKLLAKNQDQLDEAQQKAEKIIKAAQQKAAKIERQAQADREHWQKLLDKQLQAVIENNVKVFKKESKAIEKELLAGLAKEVAAYKKVQLQKVDEQIADLVNQVSQKVLGKSLSLKDQEELIFEALKKAKVSRIPIPDRHAADPGSESPGAEDQK